MDSLSERMLVWGTTKVVSIAKTEKWWNVCACEQWFLWSENRTNIAKGTTDQGNDCFNQSAYSAYFAYLAKLRVPILAIGDWSVMAKIRICPFDEKLRFQNQKLAFGPKYQNFGVKNCPFCPLRPIGASPVFLTQNRCLIGSPIGGCQKFCFLL